jgi:hypothetical protein
MDTKEQTKENQFDLDKGDKLVAILAYITLIGFIIGLLLNQNKKGGERNFNAFHLRQGLGLVVFELALYAAFSVVETILLSISVGLFYFALKAIELGIVLVLLIFIYNGVSSVLNNVRKPLPFIGKYAVRILKNAFN